jgi:hypothetical protein
LSTGDKIFQILGVLSIVIVFSGISGYAIFYLDAYFNERAYELTIQIDPNYFFGAKPLYSDKGLGNI